MDKKRDSMEENKTIKEVLMGRDGISENEADNRIESAVFELIDYMRTGELEAAEDICMDHFGLEPDYLMELMEMV
jgi:chemotaxis protein CheY-P-specific phosphatase CheC